MTEKMKSANKCSSIIPGHNSGKPVLPGSLRRAISIVLVLIMCFTSVPLTAVALPEAAAATVTYTGSCGENTTFTIDDEGTLTVSGTGKMGISDETSVTATQLSTYFYSNDDKNLIKKVVIEEGVTTISYELQYFPSVTSVTIPESVTRIEDCAFYGFSSLTSIKISKNVSYIGSVFGGCSKLENIYIDKDNPVYSVVNGCLIENESGTLIRGCVTCVIPDDGSVRTIASEAFSGNVSLKSIVIPESVTKIGMRAFSECTGLESITVDENNPVYRSSGNCIISGETVVVGCKNSKIPTDGSVSRIDVDAFYGCTELKSITIPETITEIGYGVFEGCTGLTEITIPGSVSTVGLYAFIYCTGLKTVVLSDGVASIGYLAFGYCTSLENVEMPATLTSIGDYAFSGCKNLVAKYPDTVEEVSASAFEGCIQLSGTAGENISWTFDDDTGTLTFSGTGDMENYWWNRLPQWCSYGHRIKKVVINKGITSVGVYAFSSCTGIETVVLPDSIREIGQDAFSGCTGLKHITIPSGVETVGYSTFSGCTSLESVKISDSVKKIGGYAFTGCTALSDVTIGKGVETIEHEVFEDCTSLKSIVIPAGVTSIGSDIFKNCTALTSVTLPDGIDELSSGMFAGTPLYENQSNWKDGVLYIGNYLIKADEKLSGEYTVKKGTVGIASGAFENCVELTGIKLPESLKHISSAAFYGCKGLTEIEIPDNLTKINSWVYANCTGLTSVTIPDSVKSIGSYAFSGCSGLTSLTIPDTVTEISFATFEGCSGLTSLKLSKSITEITMHAFSGCSGLTSLVIPEGVEVINDFAFSGCSGLTSVTFPGTLKSTRWQSFAGCTGLTSLVFPKGFESFDRNGFSGCYNLSSIYVPSSVESFGAYSTFPYGTVLIIEPGSAAEEWAIRNEQPYTYIDTAYISINALPLTDSKTSTVSGYATPCSDITLYVNGKAYTKVKSAANGYYEIQAEFSAEGEYTLKASVTVNGKTAEKSVKVSYSEAAVSFKELNFVHESSRLNITAENFMHGHSSVTWIPGSESNVSIGVSNSDKIAKLYLVSTKSGESKKLELTYNESADMWFGSGYFGNDTSYTPGALTIEGVYKDGKEFDCGLTFNVNFVIDPSGYVYEAVRSNRVEGATVTVYYKDNHGFATKWNAEEYEQLNPVVTPADGTFAWDVPEGQWKIVASKDGYEDSESEWMDVPPEHTDVYIGIKSYYSPEAKSVNVYKNYAEIEFTDYMDISSVNTENISFNGVNGKWQAIDKTETYEGSGVYYAKRFRFTPETAFSGDVKINFSYNVLNYAGNCMEEFETTKTVAKEPTSFASAGSVSVEYSKTGTIKVTAKNAAGMTVTASADNALISLDKTEALIGENGSAEFTVTGDMPGETEITFKLEGTGLSSKTVVSTLLPVVIHEHSMTKTEKKAATCVSDGNNEYYTCKGCGKIFKDKDGKTETTAEAEIIPASGHKLTKTEAKAATVAAAGNNAYYTCSVCKKVFKDSKGTTETTVKDETIAKLTVLYTLGDVDNNGEVSAADARLALRASVGLEKYAEGSAQFSACDVNFDKQITSGDARIILRVSVGLETLKKQ